MSTFNPDQEADSLFDGDRAEIAENNARKLNDALEVLDNWRSFLESAQADTSDDEEKLTEAMESVEDAYEKVSDLYPILAVHAGMMKVAERQDDGDSGLDPSQDRTFG